MVQVGVIDYGLGNLKSIVKALDSVGACPSLVAHSDATDTCDLLVVPGVGAFGEGMMGVRKRGLDEGISRFVESGRPVLGICLGCQMLLTKSEEFGVADGLDLIKGNVIRIPESPEAIPNVGWKRLVNVSTDLSRLPFASIQEGEWVYFVHSFHCEPDNSANVLSSVHHGGNYITAIIGENNVFGFQFHPEKSGQKGLEMLRDALRLVGRPF